ncbi:unnamed protein product [Acanthoscelides obtectus]|uniref:YqaJ viral recombinase domain-containing protein n=1 Tax=Acanthoscelides obtectus TaxID=200917 RepID=A0A9P0L3V0_ACAOB|nr:unnamed protein product [Acanthoscelides obtectus]CAK1650213.1 General transcription factor II-I repeat domain-containing protein 2 [Acanthoscelides obtectus]
MQILLLISQLERNGFDNFPSLRSLDLSYNHLKEYQLSLKNLLDAFSARFKEIDDLAIKVEIFTAPFTVRFETAPPQFLMELIKLQCNTILKDRYYHYNSEYNLDGIIAIQWGRTHEKDALDYLKQHYNLNIQSTGVWLTNSGLLGASPDGLIDEGDAIVEEPKKPARLFFTVVLAVRHKAHSHYNESVNTLKYI